MSLTIALTPETEEALRQRARTLGKTPEGLAADMLAADLRRDAPLSPEWFRKLSGDSFAAFEASGQTDEELAGELDRIKHAGRTIHPMDQE